MIVFHQTICLYKKSLLSLTWKNLLATQLKHVKTFEAFDKKKIQCLFTASDELRDFSSFELLSYELPVMQYGSKRPLE